MDINRRKFYLAIEQFIVDNFRKFCNIIIKKFLIFLVFLIFLLIANLLYKTIRALLTF